MNAWGIVSILAVIVLGFYVMRRNGLAGMVLLGVGVVAAVSAFGLTGFISSIPPALGDGVSTFIGSIG